MTIGSGDPSHLVGVRALALQASLEERRPPLVDRRSNTISTAGQLFNELRALLSGVARLSKNPLLESSMDEVWALMKMLPPREALADPARRHLDTLPHRGARSVILGGGEPKSTNFDRERSVPHFRRADGAWFEFRLIVEEVEKDRSLEILSYGYEIRFPADHQPPWIRFDLNLPGHDNADEGLRCHLHPGTEDWSVPYLVMSPFEALDLLLWHTRPRRSRARTASSKPDAV